MMPSLLQNILIKDTASRAGFPSNEIAYRGFDLFYRHPAAFYFYPNEDDKRVVILIAARVALLVRQRRHGTQERQLSRDIIILDNIAKML